MRKSHGARLGSLLADIESAQVRLDGLASEALHVRRLRRRAIRAYADDVRTAKVILKLPEPECLRQLLLLVLRGQGDERMLQYYKARDAFRARRAEAKAEVMRLRLWVARMGVPLPDDRPGFVLQEKPRQSDLEFGFVRRRGRSQERW